MCVTEYEVAAFDGFNEQWFCIIIALLFASAESHLRLVDKYPVLTKAREHPSLRWLFDISAIVLVLREPSAQAKCQLHSRV
jgi:hypothetical protein